MKDDDEKIEPSSYRLHTSGFDAEYRLLEFMAGPFYRAVNATAAFVAAFAAASVGEILSGSWMLTGLKYALLFAFCARAIHAAAPEDDDESLGFTALVFRLLGAAFLVIGASLAARSAVDAGLTQLDGDQSAKAAKVERARRRWTEIGMRYRCYDPDFSNPKACAAVYRGLELDRKTMISEPPKK